MNQRILCFSRKMTIYAFMDISNKDAISKLATSKDEKSNLMILISFMPKNFFC